MTKLEFEHPLVSIIIPTYNNACYLAEAVKSVLNQDYHMVELIVLDDGSTDDTLQVLSELGDGFYWETQVNMGQSLTLARGWGMAKGDVLGYLSADDMLEPEAVRRAVEKLMVMPNVLAIYCDFNLIDSESRLIRTVKLPEFSYEHMLAYVSCPIGPGAFFRRSAYLKSGAWNPEYRQMPDYDFWLRIGLLGRIYHLPEVLAAFRVHVGSQTYSVTSPERAAEPLLIVSSLLNQTTAMDFEHSLKACALACANLVSAQLHIRAGRLRSALTCVRRALRHSPKDVISMRTLRMLVNASINRTAYRVLWKVRSFFKAVRK